LKFFIAGEMLVTQSSISTIPVIGEVSIEFVKILPGDEANLNLLVVQT
jgi:hypothetical protein